MVSFSRKVFIGVFGTSLFVCTALIALAHQVVGRNVENSYRERYVGLSRALGRTLTELEQNTETVMHNAAQVVALEDAKHGVLSNAELKALRNKISVAHIFVINANGQFIRSTNEDPSLIPNLYSFCGKYRALITGSENALGTPIIPPDPEPKPYKFLTVPSLDRTHLIEVGVRVDFIGKMLSSAVKDDANVLALRIFAPDGTSLGGFSRDRIDYSRSKVQLPEKLDTVVSDGNEIHVFEKVQSTQTHCCQCEVAGIAKGGSYYYVIESVISKAALAATQASFRWLFIVLELIATLLAFFVARWISIRLTSQVSLVKERVREIGSTGDLGQRIGLDGNDEISFLAKQFDGLLGRLEHSQRELLSSQKKAAFGEFAGQVAHNIGTPVRALEMMMPMLRGLPDQHRRVIRNAVKEIHDLVRKLKAQSSRKGSDDQLVRNSVDAETARVTGIELLSELVEAAVSESRMQFRGRRGVEIGVDLDERGYGLFSTVETTEFKVIVANLVKNGVEALDDWEGTIGVSLRREVDRAIIEVTDDGKGISPEILSKLGIRGATYGKAGGSGIGLNHAKTTVERWGGSMSIRSILGRGTTVRLELPLAEPPAWFVPSIEVAPGSCLVVLDDDSLSRQVWQSRLTEAGVNVSIHAFHEGRELREWLDENGRDTGALFLVDYELAASGEDGLQIIESLGIAESSILVTGHFGEASVMARAQWLGVRVMPKSMVPWVPIASKVYRLEEPMLGDSADLCGI